MFNQGVEELLKSLPALGGLDAHMVKRMLTRAWLETVDRRDLGGSSGDDRVFAVELRRLATAVEVHAILPQAVDIATLRACAFVGAEALDIAAEASQRPEYDRPWLFGSQRRFERIEAALLYLIAGYDANAGVIARSLPNPPGRDDAEHVVSEWALESIRSLLLLRTPQERDTPAVDDVVLRSQRVRHAIWLEIGHGVDDYLRWLTFMGEEPASGDNRLRDLGEQLQLRSDGSVATAVHGDLHHLVLLLAAAWDATSTRALRRVPPPDDDDGRFAAFQRLRARTRPLLWPAAADYAATALPGPHAHAVVSVPTGAGKSAVAELAIAQAIRAGWVLYLAPTNALVGQVRRQLYEVIGRLDGVQVREFLGGAEYTELAGEALDAIADRQVLAMTPEKCSLALRQSPEAFERMALCIVDEAHTLGGRDSRAVIAELVISEVLHRAPTARLLMMSALVANPEDLQRWLATATATEAVVINRPWRPTRTLRAIAGFDEGQADAAAGEAQKELERLPPRRKRITFDAPLALLTGLQGAWQTNDPHDYALIRTAVTAPLAWHRAKGAVLDGYCNPAVRSLVQALGDANHRVLAFLPRSRHDSFALAREITGFAGAAPVTLDAEVEALLQLADAELGVPSALRDALAKRVAVHTGAMLREEQRASEIAFERECAWALFATSTLSQGLNLPATAVVIGGTQIGWSPDATTSEKEHHARSELLNAIGRAGRATVAARSIAIVVPSRPLGFKVTANVTEAVRRADFLRHEDASSIVTSHLDGLIAKALDGTLDMGSMSTAEQTAFAFLSFAAGDGDAEGVLSHSWAVQRAGAATRSAEIAQALGHLGRRFLSDAHAADWVALAAHRAGLGLPEAAGLHAALRRRLVDWPIPETIQDWTATMLAVLRTIPVQTLSRALPPRAYRSTSLHNVWSENPHERLHGWAAMEATLKAWMSGRPLSTVASFAEGDDTRENSGRGQRDPLPRIVRIVNDGFGFGLALVAGALGAIVAAGSEAASDSVWAIPSAATRSLALLPLAVRLGADTPPTIAWMRAGARPRVMAHLLSQRVAAPPDLDDEGLRSWAATKLPEIGDLSSRVFESDAERTLIAAMTIARRVT